MRLGTFKFLFRHLYSSGAKAPNYLAFFGTAEAVP
jgi:hypothetical protein